MGRIKGGKIVLWCAAALVLCGAVLVFVWEHSDHTVDTVISRQLRLNDLQQKWRDTIVKSKRRAPRQNLAGRVVDKNFDLDSQDYKESMYVLSLTGFCPAVACMIVASYFLLFRPTCCPERNTRRKGGYSSRERMFPTMFIVFTALCCVSLSITGYIGNNLYDNAARKAIKDMHTASENHHKDDVAIIDSSQQLALEYPAIRQAASIDVEKEARQFRSCIDANRDRVTGHWDTFKEFDFDRWVLINFAFIVSIFAGVPGVAAVYYRKGYLSMIMCVMGYLAMVLIWSSFGFHLPLSVMNGDFCFSLSDFLDTRQNNGATNAFWSCTNATCYAGTQDFLSVGVRSTFSNLKPVLEDDYNVVVTLNNVTDFTSHLTEANQTATVKPLLSAFNSFERPSSYVEGLGSCNREWQLYDELESYMCYDMLIGLNLVLISEAIIGCVLVLGVAAAFIGYYKFDRTVGTAQTRGEVEELTLLYAQAAKADSNSNSGGWLFK
eukprot:GFYU01010392.1.p1 GENE.GFYU01010392.1~~GFYU01010392.1.p1  ORF type:complete len:493 (+),score=91.02 GFYU01010392.1:132-1610(+)